jgi:hypothetical protein
MPLVFSRAILFLLALLAMPPSAQAVKAPYPHRNMRLANLPGFLSSLRGYQTQTGNPFPQVLGAVMANLQDMHPQVRAAWIRFEQQANAAGQDPYNALDMDGFRQLIANAVRQPNDLLDATARFMRLTCATALDIAGFIITFRDQLNVLAMLGAPFPDGPLLVNVFINMLPAIIRPYLLSRNHATIEDAILDAATHAQTPAPFPAAARAARAGPMDLGFIQEAEQRGVAAPVAAELLAIAQQRLNTTPARPAPPAAAGPRRGRLDDAERQRRSHGGLCMYCGTHPAGTRCEADEAKKARIAAAKAKRQGNE